MVTALGRRLGTRLGTELVDFTEDDALTPVPTFDATKQYALTGLSAANTMITATGGGEALVASGSGILALVQIKQLTGASQCFAARSGGASEGYFFNMDASGGVNFQAKATAAFPGSPRNTISPSDVGRIFLLTGYITPTLIRLFALRGERGAGTAMSGYVAPTTQAFNAAALGVTTQPATGLNFLALAAFRGLPTDAQLLSVYDAARVAGDIPAKAAIEALMPGTTVTHRWSLRDTLAAANVPVADGATAPATLPDTVTAATVDALARVGAPTIKVIDPSVDGRPTYGALGFSTSAHLKTSVGILNTATLSVELRVIFTSALASGRHILSNATGSSVVGGFSLYQSANTLNFYSYGAGAQITSVTISASAVGQPCTIKIEYTGAVWRLWVDGVQAGADSAVGYTASNHPLFVGVFGDVSSASDNVTVLSLRTGTYAAPNQHYYDLTQDVVAGGPQNGIPAQVLDRVGTDHLTRVGTGLQVAQRVERVWSYETTPILYGASGYTLTDYFEAAINALPGDPAGFTTSVLCSFQTLGAGRRLFAQRDTAGGGWEYQANASQVFFACSNGTTAATSPGSTVTADVGKMLLFTGVWDAAATTVRLYAKRLQVSTGSPFAAGYLPNTGIKPMIGRANSGAPTPGTTIYGVYYAPGIPTLAQVQAQFDAVVANESIQPVPGLASGALIDLKQDLAGGIMPSTLVDRGAGTASFTRVGNPTVSPQYARAFSW